MDFDIIVVGAGHNALVASAYLSKAGYRVGVFERRPVVGGAVSTREIVPGYRFDLGGSAHILIRLTPIVEELKLHQYGLEYIELDPLFFSPFPDSDSLFIHRSEDRTIEELEDKLPGEGEAYRRFINDWRPFARAVKEAFLTTPGPFQLGKKMFGKGPKTGWKESLQTIFRPYGDIVDTYFAEEKLKAMLVWMAAQSGPPPDAPISAPFVLWHVLYHEGGIARPRGGSGVLSEALGRAIEANGGSIFTDAPVDQILIESRRATGVRIGDHIYTGRAVLAGAHILETFGRLVEPEHRPAGLDGVRTGNGFGAILRLALDRPVRYLAHPGPEARRGLQLICKNRHQIHRAYGDYLAGRPAEDPPIVAMTFSAVDPSLAPPGGEVLWLWGQYYPYELAESHWDDIGPAVADRLIDTFEAYAPGTRDSITGSLFQHPLWLERELGLFRGNVMHLEMSIDQMFFFRPMMGMAEYRTHLKGLYLTGASTHPGGGIMGASGRNAARIVLKDLEKRRI